MLRINSNLRDRYLGICDDGECESILIWPYCYRNKSMYQGQFDWGGGLLKNNEGMHKADSNLY